MSYERLQVLLRPDQLARLRDEAAIRGVPVAALVRDALDMAFPIQRGSENWAAFAALPVVDGGPSPEDLEAQLDDRLAAPPPMD